MGLHGRAAIVLLMAASVIVPGFPRASASVSDSPSIPGLALRAQPFGRENGRIHPAVPGVAAFWKNWVRYLLDESIRGGARNRMGWFDLDVLVSEVEGVEVWENESTSAIVADGNRIGSVYVTERRAVLMNRALLEAVTPSTYRSAMGVGNECLVVHEFLGALGYPDENYELSTYLWMRTFPDDASAEVFSVLESALEDHLAANPRRLTSGSPRAGSTRLASTGVGGGGDPASAAVKIYALSTMAQQKSAVVARYRFGEQDYRRALVGVLLARLEPMRDLAPYRPEGAGGVPDFAEETDRDGNRILRVNTSAILTSPSGTDVSRIAHELLTILLGELPR